MRPVHMTIDKVVTAIWTLALLCLAPFVHAEPISGNASFDHAKTGFLLRDVHATLRCEQCHVDAVFKNTPKDCAGCHAIGTRVGATPKPVNHVQTTDPCDTCHTSPTSFLVANFKHISTRGAITSNCITCHNNQSQGVVSKPANHFPTLLPCESCHTNTSTFLSWRMDHTGLTSNCVSCHGGQFVGVVSKPVAHIPTTGDCGACHNTNTFLGSTYDHSAVAPGTCNSCHLGQYNGVVSLPVNHITTSGAQCDNCHTQANTGGYTSFFGGCYDHNTGSASSCLITTATVVPVAPGNCSSCHTGVFSGVSGKAPFHVPTVQQCDTCHNASHTAAGYATFYGATYTHTGTTAGVCGTCHNGTTALGKPASHIPATGNNCDSCHTTALATLSWLGATFVHSPMPPVQPCATCHNGVTALGKPAWHMVTTLACDSCHPNAINSNPLSFVGGVGAPNHAGFAVTSCATGACHNGVNAKGLSAGHIPTGTISCGYCHAAFGGAVTTFQPGTMQHAQVTGIRCDVCHNGAYTTQGLQYGGAQAKVSNHIPTTITAGLDCTTCHTAPTYTSSTGWLQEKMNHNGAQGMGAGGVYCVNCHLKGVTYLGSMQKLSHNGASVAKDCSSASCHKPLGKKGTPYSTWN